MNLTWYPHRSVVTVVAAVMVLTPGCGDDGGRSSDTAGVSSSTGAEPSPETGDSRACPVDENAVEDLFDVTVSRHPELGPGAQVCGFGVDGQPGRGFTLNLMGDDVPPYGSYDAAVEQLGTEPASFEGTRLVQLDAGDEAVGRASAGNVAVLVRSGDDVLLVTALLPPDHPLAQADNDLLTTTTELAKLAL